jgi:hypothetical protein
MARYPDFIAAKREDVPNYTQASIYAGHQAQEQFKLEQERKQQMLRAPVDAYKGYVGITDHNPLANAVRKWTGGKDKVIPEVTPSEAGPVGVETSNKVAGLAGGGMNAGSNAGIATLDGLTAAQAGEQLSTMVPATSTVAEGTGGAMGGVAGGVAGGVMGGVAGGLMEAQQPGTTKRNVAIKTGTGAATGTLMAAAPAMAAAGPVGWAGIAGLAALSLYGMLA